MTGDLSPARSVKGQLRIRKPRWTPALDFGRGRDVAPAADEEIVLLENDRD